MIEKDQIYPRVAIRKKLLICTQDPIHSHHFSENMKTQMQYGLSVYPGSLS